MLYLVLSLLVFGAPLTAAAQQRPSLPSIGLPLPQIGLSPSKNPPWERKTLPWWERQAPPPWEGGHVGKPAHDRPGDRRGHRVQRPVFGYGYPVYVVEPYVVEVPQPPQIIYVEVPRREEPPREEPPPAVEPPPPYVPSGNLTIYVIPGCYVGNVYPVGMRLPVGCDLNKVVTFIP
jgi:hypothetical protein